MLTTNSVRIRKFLHNGILSNFTMLGKFTLAKQLHQWGQLVAESQRWLADFDRRHAQIRPICYMIMYNGQN
jgi:hypothetical protein